MTAEMHPALKRLDELCDRIIAELEETGKSTYVPEPFERQGEHHTQKDYVLPDGIVVRDDGTVLVPGSKSGDVWTVDVTRWSCDCPAHRKWPPCKHVRTLKQMLAEQGVQL